MTDLRLKVCIASCALAVVLAGPGATAADARRAVAPQAYAAYCMGVAEQQNGRLQKSVEWFKKALTFDARSAECHVRLGTLYGEKLHNPRVGRTHFDKALALSPENFHARYGIAKQLLRAGRYDEAAAQIQTAIKKSGANVNGDLLARAYTDLATSAELRGAPKDAVKYYTLAVEKASAPVYILVRLAYLHRSMGEHAKTVDALLEVKRRVPTYAKVHRELCDSYKALRKWPEALGELTAFMKHREGPGERTDLLNEAAGLAVRAGQNEFARGLRERILLRLAKRYRPETATPKACKDIGLALAGMGRLEQAVPYLERAVESTDDKHDKLTLRTRLASVYEGLRRFDQAAEQFRECIKAVEPKDSITYRVDLCAALESAGKHEDAESVLKEITAVPALRATGHAELGLFYDRRGKTDQAAGQLREAIKLAPPKQTVRYRVHLSLVFSGAGRHNEAEQVLLKARKLFPENASVNNALGWHYAERGVKLDEALVLVRKALKAQPANPYYIDSLGWVYFKQGRKQAALSELQRAAKLSRDGIIWEHLGDVYMALGQQEKAKEHWLRSLEFDTSLKSVREKLDKLNAPR